MAPDSIIAQGAASVAVVHLIEWLKSRRWCPWITRQSASINRAVSFAAAAVATAGFSYVLVGDLHHGGTLTLSFPPITAVSMGTLLMHTLFQGGMQQLYYSLGVKSEPVAASGVTAPVAITAIAAVAPKGPVTPGAVTVAEK